jgi:phosphoglucomutase
MDQQILAKANQWAEDKYFEESDRAEVKALLENNQEEELINRFYRDLEFGTGGLRSILGMGSNRINRYNIRRATQAVANRVLQENTNSKVVVSYDSRKFSLEFAKESAAVFAANGIEVLIFDRLNPVPILSYAIRHSQATAGVMITASHNPPEYNGFKVFWSNGAQVTPPEDKEIIDQYNQLTNWEDIKFTSFDEAVKAGRIQWIGKEMEDRFHEMLNSFSYNPKMCLDNGKQLKIVYTPLHGTGKVPCTRALTELGFKNLQLVEAQAEPDSAFPTVSSPNPEDKEAMEMAEQQIQTLIA